MQSLLYVIYSGQLFFFAAAVILIVVALDFSRHLGEHPLAKRIAGFSALLALPLAVFAAPPLPLPLSLTALAMTTVYLFRGFGMTPARHLPAVMCGLAIAGLILLELPYHLALSTAPRPSHLVVIGDSLSSGGFGESGPWPALIGADLGVVVTNLSLPSADVADAIQRQLPELPSGQATVILAIGGNDMLDTTPLARFEADLEQLVAAARGKQRRPVIMLELPLLPGRWSYGRVQRELARKYDCVLLPKRILAAALSNRMNTFDGIHLNQQGHATLARKIMAAVGWTPARKARISSAL